MLDHLQKMKDELEAGSAQLLDVREFNEWQEGHLKQALFAPLSELEAGDVIQCNLEKITVDDKTLGSADENESGKYLILNLCHYFDNKNSYTYLTLVRDTYGEGGVAA